MSEASVPEAQRRAAPINQRILAAIVAVVAFAAFLWLGFFVKARGEPAIFVGLERAWVDHSTLVAWWLTQGCYPHVLIPIAVVLLALAWPFPQWRWRIFVSLAMLLLCWRVADLFQHVFARPRRLDWVVKRETSFSYPSSHAAISTGFYVWWGVVLYWSELPRGVRVVGAVALPLLAMAICWSRLALGAHYLTDLLGGVLLAIAIGSVIWAALGGKVFGADAGRR